MGDHTTQTKICTGVCGQEKPATTEFFHKKRKALYSECIPCWKLRGKAYRDANPEKVKLASKTYYRENKEHVTQKNSQRRICLAPELKAQAAQYYIENKEVIDARNNAYRATHLEEEKVRAKKYVDTHKDEKAAYAKAYYAAHAEEREAYKKKWIAENAEHMLKWRKKYAAENKELLRNQWLRRRARKKSLPDTLTVGEWSSTLEYFAQRCAVCSEQEEPLHADHWIALVSPNCPGTVVSNIIPLCRFCNQSKGRRDAQMWLTKKFGAEHGLVVYTRIAQFLEGTVCQMVR